MLTLSGHLDNLSRHIHLVRSACSLLGRRLIDAGKDDFGRILIARGFVHDATKFYGVEWKYLHAGRDIPPDKLKEAIEQHVATNDHHPEFWGGIHNMPEIAMAEMVCDWYGRSQEFGTNLRDWIWEEATMKFDFTERSATADTIRGYVHSLLDDQFVRTTE